MTDSLDTLVGALEPLAKRLSSHDELVRVRDILRVGPSYQRQRRIYEETGAFEKVIASLVREFLENIPVAV